ncbi:hypothetical protein CHCC14600_0218 [Bacillus licheniformis]|uniref:hypothetical protein n=1 Tax=Bacillus licheniformis TaxID=1402 RepID=UPI0008FB100A|nr:hypothetical protein [Bacillus licheniformis]KAA6475807.1 hypothetical protein DX928_06795 [Bacillus swezeyi]PRS16409.1 hypothetical protein C6W27_08360 [Bacillus paralicheniformis]ARC72595.1 hypothetical protein B37_00542 [Bacillus licheniformis]ARW41729.1 hypothetical protein S100141_00406 [Bacillus licheniformis]ARW56580.1 hypothetical protein S100027_04616 [Bacillus licheniformis]
MLKFIKVMLMALLGLMISGFLAWFNYSIDNSILTAGFAILSVMYLFLFFWILKKFFNIYG